MISTFYLLRIKGNSDEKGYVYIIWSETFLKNAPNRKKFHQGLAIASSHMIYYHFITYQIGQDVEKQHCFWGNKPFTTDNMEVKGAYFYT